MFQKLPIIYIAVIVAATAILAVEKSGNNWLEDEIINALEASRNSTPDPYIIDEYELSIDTDVISGVLGYSGANATGLSTFDIVEVTCDPDNWTISMVLLYPAITAQDGYYLDCVLFKEYDVTMNVSKYQEITDFLYEYSYQLVNDTDADDGTSKVLVKNISMAISLGNATVEIHGFLNNDELSNDISNFLTEHLATFINNHKKVIGKVLSTITQIIIDIVQS